MAGTGYPYRSKPWEMGSAEILKSALAGAEFEYEQGMRQAAELQDQAIATLEKVSGWLDQAKRIRAALEKLEPAE